MRKLLLLIMIMITGSSSFAQTNPCSIEAIELLRTDTTQKELLRQVDS